MMLVVLVALPTDRSDKWPPSRGDATFTEDAVPEAGKSPLRSLYEKRKTPRLTSFL